jgi:hypothetical protein
VRPKREREDNINMDIREIVCECVDFIELAQSRVKRRNLLNTYVLRKRRGFS